MDLCKIYNWYSKITVYTIFGDVDVNLVSSVYLSQFVSASILFILTVIFMSSWLIPMRLIIEGFLKIKWRLNKYDKLYTCRRDD